MPKLKIKTGRDNESSLSHTRWNCMYHIVFIPKYRRKAIYGKLRIDIACIDYIHMLLKIPTYTRYITIYGIYERKKG